MLDPLGDLGMCRGLCSELMKVSFMRSVSRAGLMSSNKLASNFVGSTDSRLDMATSLKEISNNYMITMLVPQFIVMKSWYLVVAIIIDFLC